MNYAPIILFVYNRPDHLARTLYCLRNNTEAKDSELYVFSDGGPGVEDVRLMIHDIGGFKDVHVCLRDVHLGLRDSVLRGVSDVLLTHDRAIIIEDDLITSRNFLPYMNGYLDEHNDNQSVGSITGYNVIDIPEDYKEQVYLSPRPGSWGWATWSDRWWGFMHDHSDISRTDKAGFNMGGDDLYRMIKRQRRGEIDSWAIDWAFYHYKKSLHCVYPCVSKVRNIGIGDGTNCKTKTHIYDVNIDRASKFFIEGSELCLSDEIMNNFRAFFRYSLFKKFKVFINDTFIRPVLRRLA